MATNGNQSSNIGGKLRNLEVVLTDYRKETSINLRPFVADITIYENIFNPTLHGVATVVDAVGFLSGYGFSIAGQEYIEISYELPDDTIPRREHNFFVYKIAPVANGLNLKHKRYVIYFCSLEHIEDSTTSVQKAYRGAHSETVKNIVSEFLKSKKEVNVQPTKGAQTVIIPNLRPLDAIDFVRRRSIAEQKYTSASYLFFERTDKTFQFCDIEYLIEQGRKKLKEKADTYTYLISQGDLQRSSTDDGNAGDTDPRNYNKAEFKTLFNFVQTHRCDTIEKLKKGMFKSRVAVFDPVEMKLKETTFTFNPDKTTTLAPKPENSDDFITDFTLNKKGSGGRDFYLVKDSTAPDTFVDEVRPNAASYMTRMAQNMFTASIIGDPAIVAGDIINIPKMPAFRTPDGKGNDDKLLAGEFLICGIVHKIGQESYAAEVELYRNGYSSDVEKPIKLD